MKVSGICPSCGRPASSKGRAECLYCGAPLDPVATGTVSATGSGRPVAPAGGDATMPLAQDGSPAAPKGPRATIVPRKPPVPNLYEERARRQQEEGINPIREFVSTGTGKFVLWAGGIGLAIFGLVSLIEHFQPKNAKAMIADANRQAKKEKEPDPRLDDAAKKASAATAQADAHSALKAVAAAIERVGARAGHYPDFVSSSLIGLEPGRDFAPELEFFAGGKVSYDLSIDPMTKEETFTISAVSKATGETLSASGKLRPTPTYDSGDSGGFTSSTP